MTEKTTPTPNLRRGQNKLRAAGLTLTAKLLKDMVPGQELGDPEHPGLRVRCVAGKPEPQRIFFYRYKTSAGSLRQVEIGVLGAMKLTDIRSEWQTLYAKVRSGGDPRAELKAQRQQAVEEVKAQKQADQVQALTVGKVVERYLDEKVDMTRKDKSATEARRLLQQLIRLQSWTAAQRMKSARGRRRPKLPKEVEDVADLPANEFTRAMAHDLLLAFGHTAPRSGAMARAELRAAWRYGIAAGFLPAPSPFEKVLGSMADDFGGAALTSTGKRERNLTKDECGQLLCWMAEPGTYSRTVRDALELVLRTGLRSGEVCGIHSRELSRRDGVLWLDIPAERMKGKRGKQKPHSVPIVGRAEQIVMARTIAGGGYLFSSKDPGKPIEQKVLGVDVYACSGRSKAEAYKHRRVCPVANWAPHDLRRTARTLLADMGCPFDVAEAILAHTLPGIASIYDKSKRESQKVEWLTRLGDLLDDVAATQDKLELMKDAA